MRIKNGGFIAAVFCLNVLQNVKNKSMPNKKFLTKTSTTHNKNFSNNLYIEAIKNDSLSVKRAYCFNLNNTLVKIVFSTKADAPTIEDALAKIAIRKII